MKTVLITGYRGFIGKHLHSALQQLGVEVRGVDLKSGQISSNVIPKADWCFHLAAQTDARCTDVQSDALINISGTLRVLDHYGDRVIFASSSAVNYPVTAYAISKRAAEDYVRLRGGRVVRLCNVFGVGGHGVFEKFGSAETLQVAGTGEQIRTYAPVKAAVAALIRAARAERGALEIMHGDTMSVNQLIYQHFPLKPVRFVPRDTADIMDGRQI